MIEPIDSYDWILHTNAVRMFDEKRLNPIPSNLILNKVITGWGATWTEIKADRNSIILLPHKAQIYSKHIKHETEDNTIAVTENQTVKKLKEYIIASNGKFLKFLSTPESMFKVITALHECKIDPYKQCFLLIDECHKLSKDIGYRANISVAMDEFFQFENKAMISATPFVPSDPRFKAFILGMVKHEREVKKPIKLLYVNNLARAFKDFIINYKGEQLFIFLNSLNGINSLINNCNLQGQSHIYCSEEGVKTFKMKEITNAYSMIDNSNLAKYNFLTSSFFNGLDIEGLEHIPDVLLLTDYRYVEHTILDPNTDTYQILGRFRPDDYELDPRDRIKSATHIISTKHKAPVKLQDRALYDFGLSAARYEMLLDLQASATDEFLKEEVYGEALKRQKPYVNLLNQQGDLDFFKFDNYLYEYRLKMCYGDEIAPGLAYIMSELYDVQEERKVYRDEEFESMSKDVKKYSPEGIQWACKMLIANENQVGTEGAAEFYRDMERSFPLVVRAVKVLGYDKIQTLDFKKKEIERAMILADIDAKRVHHGVIDLVYDTFTLNIPYEVSEVKEKLNQIFEELNLDVKAKSTDIKTYFIVKEFNGYKKLSKKEIQQLDGISNAKVVDIDGKKSRSVRMYKLIERKYNTIKHHPNLKLEF